MLVTLGKGSKFAQVFLILNKYVIGTFRIKWNLDRRQFTISGYFPSEDIINHLRTTLAVLDAKIEIIPLEGKNGS